MPWKNYFGLAFILWILLIFNEVNSQTSNPVSNLSHSSDDSIQITRMYREIKIISQTDISHAIELAMDALHHSKKSANQKFIATSMRKIAQLFALNGETERAIGYYDSAIIIYEKIHIKKGLSYSYNNLGGVYLHLGNIEKALFNYQKSLTLGEEMKDSMVIITGYNNFGNIYYNQYDYTHALLYYKKAFNIAEKIHADDWRGDYAANIGNTYYMQGNHQSALEYYEKAIRINAQSNNLAGTSQVLSSIGQVFEAENNYAQAITYYQKSLHLKEELKDTKGIAESLANIAGLYNNMGEYDESVTYSFKSLEIAEPSGLSEQMKCSYENLYISYSQKNKLEKALEYYTQFKDMEKEIFLKANNETIARLHTQYETEKKEKEIAQLTQETESQKVQLLQQKNFRNILYLIIAFVFIIALGLLNRYLTKKKMNSLLLQKNKEIEKQKERVDQLNKNLEEMNAAKDKFFAIISHDLKNPINLLTTSTEFMLKNLYETDKSRLEFYLSNMDKSAHSLEFLLKNLLNWAQGQLGSLQFKPQKTDVLGLAANCVKEMDALASQKGILLKMKIPPSTYAFVDPEMMRTVFRNIVSNAIKFTREGDVIEFRAKVAGSRIHIEISDTGVGMTEETIRGLFQISRKQSALGTANEKGTGLGLVLCKELIEKNNGELKIESIPGKGSLIGVIVPAITD